MCKSVGGDAYDPTDSNKLTLYSSTGGNKATLYSISSDALDVLYDAVDDTVNYYDNTNSASTVEEALTSPTVLHSSSKQLESIQQQHQLGLQSLADAGSRAPLVTPSGIEVPTTPGGQQQMVEGQLRPHQYHNSARSLSG